MKDITEIQGAIIGIGLAIAVCFILYLAWVILINVIPDVIEWWHNRYNSKKAIRNRWRKKLGLKKLR
jgi:hypothetical protein